MLIELPSKVTEIMPLLVCPRCKGQLSWENGLFVCFACQQRFPLIDGIPDFIVSGLPVEDRSRVKSEVDFFDSYFKDKNDYQVYADEEYARILDRMALKNDAALAGQKILSIGCGAGMFERELIGRNYQVIGMDLSFNFLKKCDFPVLRADAINLPFVDSTFDHVICLGVIHHLPPEKHREILFEIHRVLKDGGSLRVFEPNTTTRSKLTHPFSQVLKIRSSGERPVSLSIFKAIVEVFFNRIDISFVREVRLINYNFLIILLYQAAKVIFNLIPGCDNNEFFVLIGKKVNGASKSVGGQA